MKLKDLLLEAKTVGKKSGNSVYVDVVNDYGITLYFAEPVQMSGKDIAKKFESQIDDLASAYDSKYKDAWKTESQALVDAINKDGSVGSVVGHDVRVG